MPSRKLIKIAHIASESESSCAANCPERGLCRSPHAIVVIGELFAIVLTALDGVIELEDVGVRSGTAFVAGAVRK